MRFRLFTVNFDELSSDAVLRLPEHDLLVSVLASGISEAAGEGQWIAGNTPRERLRRQKEALRWINSDKVYCCPELGISFQFICEALDIDPEAARSVVFVSPDSIGYLMVIFRDRSQKNLALVA